MKFRNLLILLGLTGLILSGCGKDDPSPSQKEVKLNYLTSTWKLKSVTTNGDAAPGDYTAFEITLAGLPRDPSYVYVVKGRPAMSPWPSGGAWTFGSDVTTQLIRDQGTADELTMTYSVSDTQLTIEFAFHGSGYKSGRVNTVDGNWTFVFDKQQ
jgi:hypothetical protein